MIRSVEIRGLPEHAVQDTLFQITEMLHDSNDDMKKLLMEE